MKTFKVVSTGGFGDGRVEYLTFSDDYAHLHIEENGTTTIRGGNHNSILASIPPDNVLTVAAVETKQVLTPAPVSEVSPA